MAQGMQQAPARAQRPGNFNAATRQTLIQQPDQVWPGAAAQTTRLDLPQTGFFSGIWLNIIGSVTTASASSGVVATYPLTPYGVLRKIRIFNNQNVELWNTSGYGAYVYQRTLRTAFDTFGTINDAVPASGRFNNVTNPLTRYYQELSGIGSASATGNFRGALYLPVSWGFPLQHGLQMAQDPAIRYSMELTWGDVTDLTASGAASGTVSLATTTKVSVACELFQVPEEGIDFPNLAYTKTVLEDIQALSAGTGDNTYNFVTGNVLTKLMHEVTNTGTVSSTTQRFPIDPSAVTQLQLQYAQTQKPYVINADLQLFRQRCLYGSDLPPGWYVHELTEGMGLPELPTTRDVLNTSRLTDLQSLITLSGVTLATGQLRTIREQLVANR
jgi:hypothetical protein